MSRQPLYDDDDDEAPTFHGSPLHAPRRARQPFFRRLERCCCQTLTYFPLCFVYGLTTWAVWVLVHVSLFGELRLLGLAGAGLGALLWGLANASYSTAVFTGPGSPSDERRDVSRARKAGGRGKKGGAGASYEGLPTYDGDDDEVGGAAAGSGSAGHGGRTEGMTLVTAKSTGEPRFCKKCLCVKPDRTHHCSTCGQCVLKMDHHCPWLATCVGLRNYKPFLLFLIYTSLFCWLCFAISASWVWAEILDDVQMDQGLMVVNTILLAVLGGIIGLVLSGFTGWHVYLAATGQTTIESFEKTRYLSPLRKSLEQQPGRTYLDDNNNLESTHQAPSLSDQLKEIHANALPGILRPEEGEESSRSTTPLSSQTPSHHHYPGSSPADSGPPHSYASREEQRERARYAAYLDEQDSEKLPNAFDMGWRRNLAHVFGSNPIYWGLPVCNTSGDGWMWAVSPQWSLAREDVASERAKQYADRANRTHAREGREPQQQQQQQRPPREFMRWTPGQGFVDQRAAAAAAPALAPPPRRSPRPHSREAANNELQMQALDRRKGADEAESSAYDTSSDEEVKRMYGHVGIQGHESRGGLGDWNDVPSEFLASPRGVKGRGRVRSRSRGRRKGD
ncbi:hypothetical protein LTR08_000210 [Meristemomyces frigidus]|nr:hypothetical protein LTR08_000210 [Meristemomyces frigidus]